MSDWDPESDVDFYVWFAFFLFIMFGPIVIGALQ